MAEPIGERMARVEEKMKGLEAGQSAIMQRLDSHEETSASLSAKLDKVLANQDASKDSMKDLNAKISAMEPDVQTVADIKKMGVWGKWLIGVIMAFIAAVTYAKGWLILNWNFIWSATPK